MGKDRSDYNREYYEKNKEKVKARQAKRNQEERDRIAATKTPRKYKTSESRREYLRRYYQKNKDKARKYQREYNLTHKKKHRPGGNKRKAGFVENREAVQQTFTHSDIMQSPMGKTDRLVNMILRGKRDLASAGV